MLYRELGLTGASVGNVETMFFISSSYACNSFMRTGNRISLQELDAPALQLKNRSYGTIRSKILKHTGKVSRVNTSAWSLIRKLSWHCRAKVGNGKLFGANACR